MLTQYSGRVQAGSAMPLSILAAIFLSCYLTWRPSQDIMFTASDALFLLGFGQLVLAHRMPLEPFRFLTRFWFAGFIMLVGGLLIGSIVCPTPSRWLIVAAQYLFAWIVLPMILLRRGPDQTATLIKAFVWGVFAMNLFGAIVYFTYTGTFNDARALFGLDFLSGGRRLGAFASDANWNGAVLAMAIPAVLFLHAKQRVGDLLMLGWLAVLILGIVLTASFTAFSSASLAIAMFVVAGGIRFRLRTGLIAAAGSAVIAGILIARGVGLPSIFVERVGNAIGNGDISEAGTFEGRLKLMIEAWRIVEDHMLVGVGADQYRVISEYKAPVHNMYLLLWAEGGLLSLFGWLLMLSVIICAGVMAYGRDRIAAAYTLSVSVTFILASNASPHMYARLWSVPVLLAIAASVEAAKDSGPATRRRKMMKLARA
ncbi:O-antigen ligase family protein [Flavisphingomonas formosensis]|uniref:O-antigen ligase family protein n=1 Tax=Flavisphingomonas formosensis TaxID=861534 RepID=UPI0012F78D73|nr:O-antigen ligase family protein [Sphingomonas formosensis]